MTFARLRLPAAVALAFLLAACGGTGTQPPTETPTTPNPVIPTPVTPPQNPDTPSGNVPYYGEWVITYISDVGVGFRHALQVTTNVSSEGLRNAGGGLQEFCIEGGGDNCGGVYGSGFGFIGELVLDDGTAPLSMGIFTQYSNEAPELKIFTIEPIVIETDAQGQQTFTADAAWVLSAGDFAPGTIVATNVGPPRTLDPLQAKKAQWGASQLRLQLSR